MTFDRKACRDAPAHCYAEVAVPIHIRSTNITESAGSYTVEMVLTPRGVSAEDAGDLIQVRTVVTCEDRHPRLAELQRVALLRARGILDAEIQHLRLVQGHSPA